LEQKSFEELKKIANKVRIGIIDAVYSASSGHPGGSLSATDILTVLYFNIMKNDKNNLKDPKRDRFVLSKGHCSPALYSVLAQMGILEEKDLKTFRNISSNLQGHPDMNKVLGIDMTTGSLGQGLSAANGMALISKLDKKDVRIYCMIRRWRNARRSNMGSFNDIGAL